MNLDRCRRARRRTIQPTWWYEVNYQTVIAEVSNDAVSAPRRVVRTTIYRTRSPGPAAAAAATPDRGRQPAYAREVK